MTTKINVNGETVAYEGEKLSYDQALAFVNAKGQGHTVYVRGHADFNKPNETTISPGESIIVRHGMIVNITLTDTAPAV